MRLVPMSIMVPCWARGMRNAPDSAAATVGFAQLRRNGPGMRYPGASGGRSGFYFEDVVGLTGYRRHPTLCAVMASEPLLST